MRRLTPRQLILAVSLAALIATLVAQVLVVAGVLASIVALQLASTAVTMGMVAVAVIHLRRVDAKLEQLKRRSDDSDKLHRTHGNQIGAVLAALGEERLEVATLEDAQADRLNTLKEDILDAVEQLGRRVPDDFASRLDSLDRTIRTSRTRVMGPAEDTNAIYRRLEALTDLRGLIQARAPMPTLRSRVSPPDVLHRLLEAMWENHPKLVVECGSGASTVWLGYAAERIGRGRVVALEHDTRQAAMTRAMVCTHDLQDIVEVREAPLGSWSEGERTQPWCGPGAIDDLDDIGVLFVAGPRGKTVGPARSPVVELLLARCSSDAVVVFGDTSTAHTDEGVVSDQWLAQSLALEHAQHENNAGTHAFTWRDA